MEQAVTWFDPPRLDSSRLAEGGPNGVTRQARALVAVATAVGHNTPEFVSINVIAGELRRLWVPVLSRVHGMMPYSSMAVWKVLTTIRAMT